MPRKILLLLFCFVLFFFVSCGNNNKTYTIVFDSKGGSYVNTKVLTYEELQNLILPEDVTKTGSVFEGWFLDEACTKEFNAKDKSLNQTIILFAKWRSYSEIEDVKDVPVPKFLRMEMLDSSEIEESHNTPQNAYFDNKTRFDYKVNIDNTISILITIEGNNYDSVVDVIMNDSQYGENCVYLPTSTQYRLVRQDIIYSSEFDSYVSEIELLAPPCLEAGERQLTIKKIELLRKLVSDIAFDAQIDSDDDVDLEFEVNDDFIISFVVDGKVDKRNSQGLKYKDNIKINFNPEKEGFTFVGWYMDEELTEEFNLTTQPNRDLNLYSKFIPNVYQVKFTDHLENVNVYNVEYGQSLDTVPKLNFDSNEYYVWSQTDFSEIIENLNITAIKVAELTLSLNEEGNIIPSLYKDSDLITDEPMYEITCNDELADVEFDGETIRNLSSNTTYKVKVTLGEIVVENNIYIPKKLPDVKFNISNKTYSSVDFEINVIDEDNSLVGNVNKISYYEGSIDNLIQSFYDSAKRTIHNLNASTVYILEVEYEYDLNDGNGVIKGYETLEFTSIKEVPTFKINSLTADKENVYFSFEINDPNNASKLVSVELINEGNTITLEDLSINEFNNVLSNTSYMFNAKFVYDVNDDKGEKEYVLSSTIATEKKNSPQIKIINGETSNDNIIFDLEINDEDSVGELEKIELIKDNQVIRTMIDFDKYCFDELLSNNDYIVNAFYKYDLNEGKGEEELIVSETYHTLSKEKPIIKFIDQELTIESIKFGIEIVDKDETGKLDRIEVYHENDLVKTLTEFEDLLINELLSNNDYIVKAFYKYDLNEGKGEEELNVSETYHTLTRKVPEIEINSETIEIGKTSIKFELLTSDPDSTDFKVTKASYKCKVLQDSIEKEIGLDINELNNLYSDTSYSLIFTYTYDLKDGKEIHEEKYVYSCRTLALEKPKVVLSLESVIDDTLKFVVDVTDNDKVYKCESIVLVDKNDKNNEISIENLNNRSFKLPIKNTEYTVTLTYTYDLNIGYINRETRSESFRYYIINYECNGGTPIDSTNSFEFEKLKQLPITTKDGSMFAGWFYDSQFVSPATALRAYSSIMEETTLYAKWVNPTEVFLYKETDTIEITGVYSDHKDDEFLYIPDFINGKKVTKISGLLANGQEANSSVAYVYIGKNVVSIADDAFNGFSALCRVDFAKESNCEEIGKRAFANCFLLQIINLPDSLLVIGEECFYEDRSLIIFTIPVNVKNVGLRAFYNCVRIQTINILTSNFDGFESDIFPSIRYMITNINVLNDYVDIAKEKFKSHAKLIQGI